MATKKTVVELDNDEKELLYILLERERIWTNEVKDLSRFPDMHAAMDKRRGVVEGLLEKIRAD